MPETAIIKFILEDETRAAVGPQPAPPTSYQPPAQPAIPSFQSTISAYYPPAHPAIPAPPGAPFAAVRPQPAAPRAVSSPPGEPPAPAEPADTGYRPVRPQGFMSHAGAMEALRWGGENIYGGFAIPRPPPPRGPLSALPPMPGEGAEPAVPRGYVARRRRVLKRRRVTHGRRESRWQREAAAHAKQAQHFADAQRQTQRREVDRLQTQAERERQAARRPPPWVQPPPVIEPDEPEPGMLQRFMGGSGRSALPSFVGGAVGRFTGSGALGGVAGTAAGGAQGALAGMGTAGMAAAGALAGVAVVGTTVIEVFKKLYDKTGELVQSVGAYSPHVARATALAEVMDIQTQLRRSREMGPELGMYVTAKAEFKSEAARFTDTVMREVVPRLTELLKVATDVVAVVNRVVESDPTIKAWGMLFDLMKKWDPQIRSLKEIADLARDDDKRKKLDEEIRMTMELMPFWTQREMALQGTPHARMRRGKLMLEGGF